MTQVKYFNKLGNFSAVKQFRRPASAKNIRYSTIITPCILVYSYSTTKKMHLFLKLFILVKRSTRFGRSFPPSLGAQDCTYSNRHMLNSCWYLLLTAGSSNCL